MEDRDIERFDLERLEYDKDGIPVIPRIGFTIPRSYRKQFVQDMLDEVRLSPGEQLMAIFVKYMRARKLQVEAQAAAKSEVERRQIPFYGQKQPPPKADSGKEQNSGQ